MISSFREEMPLFVLIVGAHCVDPRKTSDHFVEANGDPNKEALIGPK